MAQPLFQRITNQTPTTRENNFTNEELDVNMSTNLVVFSSCFYLSIALTATFGNLLVMLAIYIHSNLQTTSNYLLANLAFTDFLQGVLSVPLRLAETLTWKKDVAILCQISIPLSILFGSTSNINILFISIERFVAIFLPYFYYQAVSARFIIKIIVGGWLMMAILAFAPTFGLGGITPSHPVTICRFTAFLSQEYILTLYIIVHFIPITMVIFIYGFILRSSLSHARRIHAQEMVVQSRNVGKEISNDNSTIAAPSGKNTKTIEDQRDSIKQRKAARIVLYVVGFFIVLVVPIIVIDVIEMMEGPRAPAVVVQIAVCMIYTNHCVNVFVYAGCNSDYRKAFSKIFRNIRDFFKSNNNQ